MIPQDGPMGVTRDLSPSETGMPEDLLSDALLQLPFAVLLFRPDPKLTLLWRNSEHERMSGSVGRDVVGRPMFEAFPPSAESADAAAAVKAITDVVDRIKATGRPEEVGPARFDLKDEHGVYHEHHWQMHFAPLRRDGRLVAIMQSASDVTEAVLRRRLAETHRRASESSASVAYFAYDPLSDRFERHPDIDLMFGFEIGEAGPCAAPFFERVHPEDLPGVHAEVARILNAPRGEIASLDYRVPMPDGTERFLRIRGEIATDPEDRRSKLIGTFTDLTEFEMSRRDLARALEARDRLLLEVNHRIRNSLQIASSMLSIQSTALQAEGGGNAARAVEALTAARARIRAIADVHGLMQVDDHITTVDLVVMLGRLGDLTRESAGYTGGELQVDIGLPRLRIESDTAVNLALSVNEALTNAVKYGPAAGAGARVRLALSNDGDTLRLVVENRVADVDAVAPGAASSGLGAMLLVEFAEAVGAQVNWVLEGETYRVTIDLPTPDGDVQDGTAQARRAPA